jgi:hypothetical protein
MTYYNRTNTCEKIKEDGTICGINFDDLFGWQRPYRERNKEGVWNGKWICNKCHAKQRTKEERHKEYRESYLTDRLTGNQNPSHSNAKGDLTEELTNRWKGTDSLNKKNDNYISPLDHSPDPITGLIYQTKSKWYDPINRSWKHSWKREQNKTFDKLILYCISKDGKTVERIYIFPREEILERSSVCIVKYQLRKSSGVLYWYEEFRVTNEDELKKVNKIWEEILEVR